MNRSLFAVSLFVILGTAHAGGPKDPSPPPVVEAPAPSAQAAAEAEANAAAEAEANAAAAGGAGGSGVGSVTASPSFSTNTKALALGLPGQTGAPAVGGHPCLEHERGGSGLSIGVSGRTRLNEQCLRHEQCMAVARLFIEVGDKASARAQLATKDCGGVALVPEEPVQAPPPGPSCEEHVNRVFEACNQK